MNVYLGSGSWFVFQMRRPGRGFWALSCFCMSLVFPQLHAWTEGTGPDRNTDGRPWPVILSQGLRARRLHPQKQTPSTHLGQDDADTDLLSLKSPQAKVNLKQKWRFPPSDPSEPQPPSSPPLSPFILLVALALAVVGVAGAVAVMSGSGGGGSGDGGRNESNFCYYVSRPSYVPGVV